MPYLETYPYDFANFLHADIMKVCGNKSPSDHVGLNHKSCPNQEKTGFSPKKFKSSGGTTVTCKLCMIDVCYFGANLGRMIG